MKWQGKGVDYVFMSDNRETPAPPDCFTDLNLDQTIDAVTAEKGEPLQTSFGQDLYKKIFGKLPAHSAEGENEDAEDTHTR